MRETVIYESLNEARLCGKNTDAHYLFLSVLSRHHLRVQIGTLHNLHEKAPLRRMVVFGGEREGGGGGGSLVE